MVCSFFLSDVNQLRWKLAELATGQQETDVANGKMTPFGRIY
jgi:hypothetical protein